jgi:DNA transposition AAA+ family ATPase
MDSIKQQRISGKLSTYCERYGSQNKAAASLKGVSAATISQILAGNTTLISDEMWRNIASQIGYRDESWEPVETRDFKLLTRFLADAKENSLVMAVTGNAGSGKSFTARHFTEGTRQVYMLCGADFWNRKMFLQELLTAMGRDYTGYSVGEMMAEVVRNLKVTHKPLIIIDEADKLTDQVLYFFITLYNQLEDECGIVLMATNHLEKRLRKGLRLNKKGYNEIWSRIGRKCIELKGVGAADIVAVCEANGVTSRTEIEKIINDSDSDLRRVRRKIHGVKKAENGQKAA